MSPVRQLLWLVTVCASLALIVLAAQISLTPEVLESLYSLAGRIIDHLAVKLLLVGTGVLFLLSLCVAAWERSERRYEREQEQRRRAIDEREAS